MELLSLIPILLVAMNYCVIADDQLRTNPYSKGKSDTYHQLSCFWCLHRYPVCLNKLLSEPCKQEEMTVLDRKAQHKLCSTLGYCKETE